MIIPHKEDLATNSKLPGMLTEDMKAIEQEYTQLEKDLQAEEDARQNADNQEAEARSEADSAEQQSRQAEDNNLQSQVNILRGRLDTAESNISNLQTRMETAEEQIKKLNEIIFGTEYINDTDELALDDSMTPGKEVEVSDTKVIDDDQALIDTSTDDYAVAREEIN